MRITAVETRRYRVDLEPPLQVAWDPEPRSYQEATLVGVHTDEGLDGLGERRRTCPTGNSSSSSSVSTRFAPSLCAS